MELLTDNIGLEALGRETDKAQYLDNQLDLTIKNFYKKISKIEDEIKSINATHSPTAKDTYEHCLERINEIKNILKPSQKEEDFKRLMHCILVELSPTQREVFRQVIILNKSNSQVVINNKKINANNIKKHLEEIRLKFSEENSALKRTILKNKKINMIEITKTLRTLFEDKPINADYICCKVIEYLNKNIETKERRKLSKESSLWYYQAFKNIEVKNDFKEAQETMKQVKQDKEERNKASKYFEEAEELFKEVDLEWNKSKAYKAIKLFNKGAKITINRKLNDTTKYRKAIRMAKDARSAFNYDKDLEKYNQQITKADELAKESEPDYEKIYKDAKEKMIKFFDLYDTDLFKIKTQTLK